MRGRFHGHELSGKHPRSLTRSLTRITSVGILTVAALTLCFASFAAAVSSGYPDVPDAHPYGLAISQLSEKGIIAGYPDGRFGPANAVTRQQFAKMIVLTMGYEVPEGLVCPFGDVSKTPNGADPFYPASYVAVCALRGVTRGKTASLFDPYANISRLQVLTMVIRALDDSYPGLLETPASDFTPTWGPGISPQHAANAARAEYNGLLYGVDVANLDPLGAMTRGEIAQVLYTVLEKTPRPATTTTTAAEPTPTSSTSTTIEWTTSTTCG